MNVNINKRIAGLVFVSLFVVAVFSQQQYRIMESISFKSAILGQEIRYSVVLPGDYGKSGNSGKSYPVMYLLHGLGDNESSWLEYGRIDQEMDRLIGQRKLDPFICVMPQGFTSYYSDFYDGSFNYEQMFVKELVPLIDSCFRTIPASSQRAVCGYSMGGFGALMLPARNPDVFGVSIALSASIRTDEQYMAEDREGWDWQWGRIFGGTGENGTDRVTAYYRKNSPFHVFADENADRLNRVAYYIVNGDKENTLCRSNEMLHMLLLKKGIHHVYRVDAGGHEFNFWRKALSEAFRFADSCFRNKAYEQRSPEHDLAGKLASRFTTRAEETGGTPVRIIYPENQKNVSRLYPVVYFVADLSEAKQNTIFNLYEKSVKAGDFPPVIFCFVPANAAAKLTDEIIPQMENSVKIRPGWRFRAVWSLGEGGNDILRQVAGDSLFAAAAFTASDIRMTEADISGLLDDRREVKNRTWFYIDTKESGEEYPGNGLLHIYLRENDFRHEYRVRGGSDTFDFLTSGFLPAFSYISKKFHN